MAELLVVTSIILLMLGIAVPAFQALTGNRSIEAAQNQLSAIIGRARQDAIGAQDYRGVLLFQDPTAGISTSSGATRVCAVEVYYCQSSNQSDPFRLEEVPARDELLLSPGISFRSLEDQGTYSTMNVILFDSTGQLVSRPWTIPMSSLNSQTAPDTPPAPAAQPNFPANSAQSLLGWRIAPQQQVFPASMPSAATAPSVQGTPATLYPVFFGTSAFGFRLFPDEDAYQNAYTQNPGTTYMFDNGVNFLINRYNGTLLRSE